ncbi:hypothetical protein ACIREM_00430 [Streptomyces shenzhenensis]|uniref:hypothetical protein n=1 Tax=Streptomyces shenzhenensis TaxID=943815 RepID=UPI00381CD2DC
MPPAAAASAQFSAVGVRLAGGRAFRISALGLFATRNAGVLISTLRNPATHDLDTTRRGTGHGGWRRSGGEHAAAAPPVHGGHPVTAPRARPPSGRRAPAARQSHGPGPPPETDLVLPTTGTLTESGDYTSRTGRRHPGPAASGLLPHRRGTEAAP